MEARVRGGIEARVEGVEARVRWLKPGVGGGRHPTRLEHNATSPLSSPPQMICKVAKLTTKKK